jgi:hypothetical protein
MNRDQYRVGCRARPAALNQLLVGGLGLWLLASAAGSSAAGPRRTLNFNPDWKFIKADPSGAARPDYNDESWSRVSAPHTFNDTDTFAHW